PCFLSCLVVIIGSLVWTASAQQDFESDRERVIEIFKNADPDSIKDSDVIFLLDFLDKYGDQMELTPEQRSQIADVVRQYNEEKAKHPLVDGAPPQGGWVTKLLRELAIQVGIAIATEGFKKATGSK
ncbi:hypothetical protein KR054_000094, partial [Drosophila jambulina]